MLPCYLIIVIIYFCLYKDVTKNVALALAKDLDFEAYHSAKSSCRCQSR